jgi:hypothetical protein
VARAEAAVEAARAEAARLAAQCDKADADNGKLRADVASLNREVRAAAGGMRGDVRAWSAASCGHVCFVGPLGPSLGEPSSPSAGFMGLRARLWAQVARMTEQIGALTKGGAEATGEAGRLRAEAARAEAERAAAAEDAAEARGVYDALRADVQVTARATAPWTRAAPARGRGATGQRSTLSNRTRQTATAGE